MNLVEIRCPGEREHSIKDSVFRTCGNIMGGISDDHECNAIFHCHVCGFFNVVIDSDGNITIDKIDTSNGKRIEFKKKWRMAHNV